MTTFDDLTNDVLMELHGQTSDLEQVTYLTQDIGTTDTTLQVDDASQVSRGLIEVDDELMWVTKVDTDTNTVTLAPFGRGSRKTTAATHAQNVMVTDNPRFPRGAVKLRIQQALGEIYPEIYPVRVNESNTVDPVRVGYGVPSDCDTIIQIRVPLIGPSNEWMPVKRWRFNPTADTDVFPSGKSVDIGDPLPPGQIIEVVYAGAPGTLTAGTDTLASTGFDDNVRDILVYGACYRLVAGLEIARLQNATVQQGYDKTTYVGTTGAATAGSKYYLQLFQNRLASERQRLQQLFPTTTHMSR